MELNPAYHPAAYNLGVIYLDLNESYQAATLLTTAIENDNSNPKYYVKRGDAFYKLKRYDSAIKDYQTSISMDP